MTISIEQRLEMRKRPLNSQIMYQEWRHLLFLHWKYEKEDVQKKLPKGLYVDTFLGDAYVTIVPFFIKNLRGKGLPPVPFLSNFTEVNVRTYVYDQNGKPGIYFFSLDINSLLATFFARNFFFLPYQHTKFTSKINKEEIHILGNRKNNNASMSFDFYISTEIQNFRLESTTLDFFLLERYALFTCRKNQLYMQQIYHSPYELSDVKLIDHRSNLFEVNHFQPKQELPNIIHYCKGLDVEFFSLKKCVI